MFIKRGLPDEICGWGGQIRIVLAFGQKRGIENGILSSKD